MAAKRETWICGRCGRECVRSEIVLPVNLCNTCNSLLRSNAEGVVLRDGMAEMAEAAGMQEWAGMTPEGRHEVLSRLAGEMSREEWEEVFERLESLERRGHGRAS